MNEDKFKSKANKNKRPYTDEELSKMYDENDTGSARYHNKIGDKQLTGELVDMLVYPMNLCPYCKSKNTYHARMQMRGIPSNVWKFFIDKGETFQRVKKIDLCLKCQKEFLIEVYTYKILK